MYSEKVGTMKRPPVVLYVLLRSWVHFFCFFIFMHPSLLKRNLIMGKAKNGKPKVVIRMSDDLRLLVDSVYKVEMRSREENGVEGKYSLNDCLTGMLWGYMYSDEGRRLIGVYDECIAPVEKAERVRREVEKRKVMEEIEDGEKWI